MIMFTMAHQCFFYVVRSDIVPKFKKFLVEEWENEISVNGPHNFIYDFFYTVGEGHI